MIDWSKIDPAKVTPVPKADSDKLRMAIREKVVKPMLSRRLSNWLNEQEARLRPILPRLGGGDMGRSVRRKLQRTANQTSESSK